MHKYNWNYPTTMWVGENRIKDIALACKDLKINKKIYIHINTTNPILLPSSDERKIVEENGWQVSYDGMEIDL